MGEWVESGYPSEQGELHDSNSELQRSQVCGDRAIAREIVRHLTPSEQKEAFWRSCLFAIWNAATFFGPLFSVMFLPPPMNWILGIAVLVGGLAFYPLFRRLEQTFLCGTEWARQQGITMEMWNEGFRMVQTGLPQVEAVREASLKTTVAAVVTLFFAGAGLVSLLSILRLGVLETLILGTVIAVVVWRFELLSRLSHSEFRRGLSWVAFALSLPLIAIGGFLISQFLSESGGWHPGPSEVVFVPLALLGMLALPWAGVVLWHASQTISEQKNTGRRPGCLVVLTVVGLIVAMLVGLMIATYFWSYSRSPRLEASCVVREVRDNVIILDTQVIASEGTAQVGFSFEGPALSADQLEQARRTVADSHVGIIGPHPDPHPRMVQGLLANRDRMSIALVFPDSEIAQSARAAMISPSEVRIHPVKHVQAHKILFTTNDRSGQIIIGSMFLGRPSLGQGATIEPGGVISFSTDTVNLPPASVTRHGEELKKLQAELSRLLTNRGEQHPEVLQLRARIRSLSAEPGVENIVGIGIALQVKIGRFLVAKVLPNSPAASRLKPGDEILRVGDTAESLKDVRAMSIEQVVELIRGKEGTEVVLMVKSIDDGSAERLVTLVRSSLAKSTAKTAEVSGVLLGPNDQPLAREILIFVKEGTPMNGPNPGTL
ncbi:MAG: PDZ domain-containing protein, partial [Verrucomicrobiales bacterium]|nr:PDZ domain-containing protein [Verrucomicrobiales bacterium]